MLAHLAQSSKCVKYVENIFKWPTINTSHTEKDFYKTDINLKTQAIWNSFFI